MSTRDQLADSIHELVKLIFTSRFFYATIAFVIVLCLILGQDDVRSWISALSGWAAALMVWPTISFLRAQIQLPTFERRLSSKKAEFNAYEHILEKTIAIRKTFRTENLSFSRQQIANDFYDEITKFVTENPHIGVDFKRSFFTAFPLNSHAPLELNVEEMLSTLDEFRKKHVVPTMQQLEADRVELEAQIDRLIS